MKNEKAAAVCYAIAAAVFYALNVPCSKLLLDKITPTFMAALLYLGAGAGVGIMYLFHHKHEAQTERLEKKDLPYTVGMVLLDIIAPILLMLGVKLGTSANASLLGNFEIVATTLIALFIFKEKVSRKLWVAIGLITLSSIILSFGGEDSFTFSVGSLLVLGATACWGLENNCTRSISDKSTYQIVTIKGFGSGTGSFIVAVILGEKLPELRFILPAVLLGFVAYGLSIFTYIRAQKTLGAAKTSAFYAIAPFIGAMLSFIFLRESLTITYMIAFVIMVLGTVFVVSDTLSTNDSMKEPE
ncbi:DMT family transporter [uncultured Ruminococcus sp.]|uniref:DMT family transporter n=1 Tax=uncultured Ruminococcus sp. TaxID=165186 RepID=UPI0025CC9DC9|nr:DMT family transporter [uncultured Ruminococcus sp.]